MNAKLSAEKPVSITLSIRCSLLIHEFVENGTEALSSSSEPIQAVQQLFPNEQVLASWPIHHLNNNLFSYPTTDTRRFVACGPAGPASEILDK